MKPSTLSRILLLVALLIAPTSAVYAQTPNNNDVLLFGENYTLGEGETLNGSIAVFGGNIEIEKEAEVNGSIAIFGGNISLAEETNIQGDIAVFGGNLTITGAVSGDIVIFGGQVKLQEEADITGNITTFGGQVEREPGAKVSGDINNNTPPEIDVPEPPSAPQQPETPEIISEADFNPLWDIVGTFGRAVAVAAIGMLLTLFLQPQLDRANNLLVQQPLMSGGYGLLTLIIVPVIIVILTITIILIPIALIAALAIPLAWLFGVVAIGQEVGDRFAKAINQVWAPVLSTGFGTFIVVLLSGWASLIPCVGWLASFVITLLAIGITVMTRFGTFTPSGPAATPVIVVDEVPPAS